jgi:hypothetical protein
MIRARTEYYRKNGENIQTASVDAALASGAPRTIERWWNTPGFQEWWNSPNWAREEAEELMLQAMSRVSEILGSSDEPTNTVLAAAKEAREIYTKLNQSTAPKFADEEINSMDKQALEEYIRRSTRIISNK